MGIIEDKKKFKTQKDNDNPVNPSGSPSKTKTNKFDIEKKTIKDQQNKK